MPNQNNHAWLRQGSTSSEEVEKSYDGWAPTYDDTLAEWDYRAPEEAAIILQSAIPKNSRILDVGCGTGLMGIALRKANFSGPIDGIDISAESLSTAKKCGVYRSLRKVDLQEHILDISDDAYDALTCIGVLTYVPETEAILEEFARVIRKEGKMIFTQRDDLFHEREVANKIESLVEKKLFAAATISEPKPYLPNNPDFGDNIKVIYVTATVT